MHLALPQWCVCVCVYVIFFVGLTNNTSCTDKYYSPDINILLTSVYCACCILYTLLRSAVFWEFAQCRMVSTDISGQPISLILKDQGSLTARPLKMGLTGCHETLIQNFHSILCKVPEEHISFALCGSLKLHTLSLLFWIYSRKITFSHFTVLPSMLCNILPIKCALNFR